MGVDKRISASINSSVNVIIARLLLAVFAVVVVVVLLTYLQIFATTMTQMNALLIAAAPGGICGILILALERVRDASWCKYVVCALMCLQAIAVALTAYSYVGTIILILPVFLSALYPRSKAFGCVAALMIVCGVVIPPVALILGLWDGGYYEFLYDLSNSRLMDTATLSNEMLTLQDQIVCALQYCSSQNVLIIGGFTVIGYLVYRQTNKSFESQKEVALLSEVDELTGLLNRRCFERRLEEEDDSLNAKDIACVYFDVNGLHEMNNTQGHAAGDSMLRFVASEIRESFGEDNAFRVGGDEFVAFSEGLSDEFLMRMKNSLDHDFDVHSYHVAIGFERTGGTRSLREVVELAEAEMYEVKRAYYVENDRQRHDTSMMIHAEENPVVQSSQCTLQPVETSNAASLDEFDGRKTILKLIIHALIAVSTAIIAITGILYGASSSQEGDSTIGLGYFQPFTMDCNIIAGVCSLLIVYFTIKALISQKDSTPAWVDCFQHVAATCLLLTFVTVAVFLAPSEAIGGASYFDMFSNDLFVFHLTNPILAVLSFIYLGPKRALKPTDCLWSLIPVGLYVVVYFTCVVVFGSWSDFYGFSFGGNYYLGVVAVAVILALTCLCGLLLIWLHNKVESRIKQNEI